MLVKTKTGTGGFMSRKCIAILSLLLVVGLLTGCATSYTPLVGMIYTADVKGPVGATSVDKGTKTGSSLSTMVLGVSYGDGSIQKAAENGGITQIKTVDVRVKSVLGIYVEATTIVTGN